MCVCVKRQCERKGIWDNIRVIAAGCPMRGHFSHILIVVSGVSLQMLMQYPC